MATDLKKFLDQAGVSTLWSRVAEEVAKVDKKAVDNAAAIKVNADAIAVHESKIAALEAGTYDDSEVRNLIADNVAAIAKNAGAIATLNGGVEDAGSVAHTATQVAAAKVAEIVAEADESFDTLKEIADWILNDTTGAADMANDIKALQAQMAGVDETVVKSIAAAIETALKVDGADKYALASDLSALADRVKVIEDAKYQDAEAVASAIDAKIAALDLANTYDAKGAANTAEINAKAYADGLAGNYDAAGSAAAAEAAAKSYADGLASNYDNAGAAASALADAKAYADGLAVNYDAHGSATQALLDAKAYTDAEAAKHETKGAAAQALTDAKAYTDAEFAKVQALTTAEIEAAIAAAKAE